MIAIVNYGVGNLFSLASSFAYIGQEPVVTSDTEILAKADKIILPGVGAFSDAAKKLRETGLGEAVIAEAKKGQPLLGICLGMQLLFEESFEYGQHQGLGLIPGQVRPLTDIVPEEYKIPQIGWNALIFPKDREKSRLYSGIAEGEHVYFVHSYYAANCHDYVSANCEYGALVTASVERENIFGAQFHPEKSGKTGLRLLRNFAEL